MRWPVFSDSKKIIFHKLVSCKPGPPGSWLCAPQARPERLTMFYISLSQCYGGYTHGIGIQSKPKSDKVLQMQHNKQNERPFFCKRKIKYLILSPILQNLNRGPFWTTFFENDSLDEPKNMPSQKKLYLFMKMLQMPDGQKRKMVIKIEFIYPAS